MTNQLNN